MEISRIPPVGGLMFIETPEHVLYDTDLLGEPVRFFASGWSMRDGTRKDASRAPDRSATLAWCLAADCDINLFTSGMLPAGYEKEVRSVHVATPHHKTLPRLSIFMGQDDEMAAWDDFPVGKTVPLAKPFKIVGCECFSVLVHGPDDIIQRARVCLIGPLRSPCA